MKDVALLWEEPNRRLVHKKLHRYARAGKPHAVRQGLYAKNRFYDRFELATRIFSPSYVSLESVLAPAGITSPYPRRISVVTYLTREVRIDQQTYCFRKIRHGVLHDLTGIDIGLTCTSATLERAFLDLLYLGGDHSCGNLAALDWDAIGEILPIYGGHRRMERTVRKLRQRARQG